jgi:hypothetical protein
VIESKLALILLRKSEQTRSQMKQKPIQIKVNFGVLGNLEEIKIVEIVFEKLLDLLHNQQQKSSGYNTKVKIC